MKKVLVCLILALVIFTTPINGSANNHTVTDMTGRNVKVPQKVKRVADLWHANNEVILLLGGEKKLVATTPMIKKQHWFITVDPEIKTVTAPFAGDQMQIEELLKVKPDVVIASDPMQLKAAREAKIPAVNMMFTDFAGLKKSITLTAEILGGDSPRIAKEYNHELDNNIDLVKQRLRNISNRPSVVHFVNAEDLTKVDGKKTIVDQWITVAGGSNAITKHGNQITVTAEELIKKNPDVIIVGSCSTNKARRVLKASRQLRDLSAVKNNKIYGNPQGVFPWDRYSGEEALQVLWAAKLFHPNQMKDIDMKQSTKKFYQKYYHYQLSNKQVKQILNGDN